MERKPKIVGKKIVIANQVNEEMTFDEFEDMYAQKSNELFKLQESINNGRTQLRALEGIEETEELKELAAKMRIAEKIVERDKLREQMQQLEIDFPVNQKELKQLSDIQKKITEMKKEKK